MIAQIFRQFLYGLIVYGLLVFSHSVYAQTCAKSVNTGLVACSASDALQKTKSVYPHMEPLKIYDGNIGNDVYVVGGWSNYNNNWSGFKDRYVALPSCPAGTRLNGAGECIPEVCGVGMREWNGQCFPSCGYLQNVNQETGACECTNSVRLGINEGVETSGAGSIPDSQCLGGCKFSIVEGVGLGGVQWAGVRGKSLNQTCSGDDVPGEPNDKPMPETKEPPCAPGEGVGTSSSGKVLCVPEGTPNAPKPIVNKTEKKETFPDGSEKTTKTTTTKDPSTGATNTSSTSTSTGGMAGSAGSSTTTENSTGKGKGSNGNDDDGDDENVSGGCESFSCSGDAIDCSIAEASWKAACIPESRKTTGGDNCDAEPTCEGDAIDCAVLKKQWENNCLFDWAKKENEFSEAFNSAKSKMDDPDKFVQENDDNVFKLENHVSGSSACPAAIVVPVFGRTIDAPTDWICGYLGLIAIVLKVLAWLFVGRMVLGAF